jgi:hypothetical protein
LKSDWCTTVVQEYFPFIFREMIFTQLLHNTLIT